MNNNTFFTRSLITAEYNDKKYEVIDTEISELYTPIDPKQDLDNFFAEYESKKDDLDKLGDNNQSHQYLVDQAIELTNGEVIVHKSTTNTFTNNEISNVDTKIEDLQNQIEECNSENEFLEELNKNLNVAILEANEVNLFDDENWNGSFDEWNNLNTKPDRWKYKSCSINKVAGVDSVNGVRINRTTVNNEYAGTLYSILQFCKPNVLYEISGYARTNSKNNLVKIFVGDPRGGYPGYAWYKIRYFEPIEENEWFEFKFTFTPKINYRNEGEDSLIELGGTMLSVFLYPGSNRSTDIGDWVEFDSIKIQRKYDNIPTEEGNIPTQAGSLLSPVDNNDAGLFNYTLEELEFLLNLDNDNSAINIESEDDLEFLLNLDTDNGDINNEIGNDLEFTELHYQGAGTEGMGFYSIDNIFYGVNNPYDENAEKYDINFDILQPGFGIEFKTEGNFGEGWYGKITPYFYGETNPFDGAFDLIGG